MKISYKDLLGFLKNEPSKDEISKKLFQLGHEHEINGDIFDIEFTPNRGDCLSVHGLARDLNIFYGNKPLKIFEDKIDELNFDFINLSESDCPQITFLEIEIDNNVACYKKYLQNFFEIPDNKKINFFTDISNYLSYEIGQPTHCFDRDKIDKTVIFERKECEDSFRTLTGVDINLKGDNCVFSVDNKVISLAGIMGGESTSCSLNTTKAIIECAYFNPEAIIGKSIKYNINSDAAYKFERGVDPTNQEIALRRFIKIVQDHTGIKSLKIKSYISKAYEDKHLPLNVEKINSILGTNINKNEYKEHLENLGFKVEENIKIPAFRHDVSTQNDLAEEIARVIGYDNIKNSSINLVTPPHIENKKVRVIEDYLVLNGFAEVVNFPFTSINTKGSIIIDNPLDKNKFALRTSLRESLLENLLFNERRQKNSIKLFELSEVYSKKDEEIDTMHILGLIVSGNRGNNYIDYSKKLDFQYLSDLLTDLAGPNKFLIEEIQRNKLNTKKKDRIYYVEISLEQISEKFVNSYKINSRNTNFIKYTQVSEFPSSTRDLSFLVKKNEDYIKLQDLLLSFEDKLIKSVFIFDFYKNVEKNEIKIAFRFIFQSSISTITDCEVNKVMDKIIKCSLKLKSVSIPGLN